MTIDRADAADAASLAAFAALHQRSPERHIAYLSLDAGPIARDLRALTEWPVGARMARRDGNLVGWLVPDVDPDMGRVWWLGPFADDDGWQEIASALYRAAQQALVAGVTEQECAADARHDEMAVFAGRNGFVRDPGSVLLRVDRTRFRPGAHHPVAVRAAQVGDVPSLARLHDALFPGSHTRGESLMGGPDGFVLVAESNGRLTGYLRAETQTDGSGYIDFVGVALDHRRRRVGSGLVEVATAQLLERCNSVHLTVRESNDAARRMYARLGFMEDRVLVPYRRGFSLV